MTGLVVAAGLLAAACSDRDADATNDAAPAVGIDTTAEEVQADPVERPDGATARASAPPTRWRTDVQDSGNRWAQGTVDLTAAPIEVALPGTPLWVVAFGPDSWHVELADGTAVTVHESGSVEVAPSVSPDPPEVRPRDDGDGFEVVSALRLRDLFVDPLPDTRVVYSGPTLVALAEPTDRYRHGVLGDRIEAGAIEIVDTDTGSTRRITIEAPAVVEGISPMLADLDGDGEMEIVVTTAQGEDGARLEAWSLDGEFVAASLPIGRGNRWRNQLGAAPLGPNGEIELVDVQTPHIGGIVQFFRLEGDQLVRQAQLSSFTTHEIGSRNLDQGVLVDSTGDGRPEVLVLSTSARDLVAIERTADGADVVAEVPLDSSVRTNLALRPSAETTALAVGTSDGRLLVWTG